jgi:dTDP-4-amino-4,6-dideoxygalactose transaminase
MYDEGLSDIPEVICPPISNSDYFDVYQNYVIRTEQRDKLLAHLQQSEVEVLVSWRVPMHKQKALGLNRFKLPMTERISAEVISLPMYPELTDGEVEFVIEAVKNFFH